MNPAAIFRSFALVTAVAFCTLAQADVSPPVRITMPRDTLPAISGNEYSGRFVVEVGEGGVLSNFSITGEGWTVLAAEFPPAGKTEPGVIHISFRATPTDAEQPIGLRFRHNGRVAKRFFKIGPEQFARAAAPRLAKRIDAPGNGTSPDTDVLHHARHNTPLRPTPTATPNEIGPRGDAVPLHFTGRFVYTRTDGRVVGADNIRVWVMDDDGLASDSLVDETIWEGVTDANGFFDSGIVMWDDCDVVGCDEPDIYVHFECDTPICQVQTTNVDEVDYYWRTMDNIIEDFTGQDIDFGMLAPGTVEDQAAVHIWNSIIRAHRFILERSGINLPIVDVQWPESSDGAYYNDFFQEIHVGPDRTWLEGTHTHEYGHHFLETQADPLGTDYCNGFCDGDDPGCDFDLNCPDEGHCSWCPENDHDAFNEGWPDWLGDVIPRDYPNRYIFADGTPYVAFGPKDYESINTCCTPAAIEPLNTEGFVAALLRDIEDAGQDDHDSDGIRDLLCLGPEEILYIADAYEPQTMTAFLAAFRIQYPQHNARLWATAFNVGGEAFSGPNVDSTPPGTVQFCDSPSHPIGTGGGLPCITLDFDAAPDEGTGASFYSLRLAPTAAGLPPDITAEPVTGTADCRLRATVATLELGNHYVSIRARDSFGFWSPNFATFGPFEVTDCNGNGVLDVCDIRCCEAGCEAGPPGICSFGAEGCPQGSCENSFDCNGNFKPDECDIAAGESQDCNEDGIPDECQIATIKHWTGAAPSNPTWWHSAGNWEEGAVPAIGDDVCIPFGTVAPLLRQTNPTIGTLACRQNLEIAPAAGLGGVLLTLQEPSFILGSLTMSNNARLVVGDELTIHESLNWSSGTILGGGDTYVLGGHSVTGTVGLQDHTLHLLCDTVSTGGFNMSGSAVVHNFAGHTYRQSDGIVLGSGSGLFENDGIFLKPGGAGATVFGSPVDNSGEMRAMLGTLQFSYALTSTGDVIGQPGTLLHFTGSGARNFQAASSVIGDELRFSTNTNTVRGAYEARVRTRVESGATLTFAPGATVSDYGPELIIGGTANFQAVHGEPIQLDNVSITGLADFDSGDPIVFQTLRLGPSTGTLRGASQQMTVNGLLDWRDSADVFDAGTLDANGGIMIAASSGQRDLARVLNNAGTATFLGNIGPTGSGQFRNLAGATAILQGDFTGLTSGTSTNAGTIIKTAGTGRSTLAGMANSGLIHAQIGEIFFYNGGSNTGEIRGDAGTLLTIERAHPMSASSTLIADDIRFAGQGTTEIRGSVNIADTLTMDGGICTFMSEADVSSYGQNLSIVSGTVQFQAPTAGPTFTLSNASIAGNVQFGTGQPVNIATLTFVSGVINGTDAITTSGPFTWNSGTINVGADFTANGPVTINSLGNSRNLLRDFSNAATMTFLGGGISPNNADITNLATGTIDIRTTGAAFGLATNSTLFNNGTLVKSAGNGISTIGNHFRNAGTVDVQIGTLQFTGTNGITSVQTAGQTILNGGNLAVTAPGTYQILGGELAGSGTITGNVANVGGAVKPGLSAGALAVVGTYNQAATGSLRIEVGGTAAGQFDVLAISGVATLAGELNVQRLSGYVPVVGDSFDIVTAGSISGTFGSLTGAPGFSVAYAPNRVILSVTGTPLPGDLDGDCDVDLVDLANLLTNYGLPSGATLQMGDADGDGDVDLIDLATLLSNYGTTC